MRTGKGKYEEKGEREKGGVFLTILPHFFHQYLQGEGGKKGPTTGDAPRKAFTLQKQKEGKKKNNDALRTY